PSSSHPSARAVPYPLSLHDALPILLGLVFALFAPGYAFIAALFPERGPRVEDTAATDGEESERSAATLDESVQEAADDRSGLSERVDPRRAGSIDGIERVALSFGLSIAITPLIGLLLNFTPFGIRDR